MTEQSEVTQPSDSVVEDVARAICRRTAEINWEDGSLKDVTAWENETPGTREHFRDLAKAALAAQPSDDDVIEQCAKVADDYAREIAEFHSTAPAFIETVGQRIRARKGGGA